MTDQVAAKKLADIERAKAERDFKRLAIWLPRCAVGCIIFLLLVYFINFTVFAGNNVFGDNSAFGTFGDFMGGALNPIFGFFTVWLLVKSIRFQIDELKLTREEMQASTNVGRETKELHAINLKNEKDMFIVKTIMENFTLLSELANMHLHKVVYTNRSQFKELRVPALTLRFTDLINLKQHELKDAHKAFEQEQHTNTLSDIYSELSLIASDFLINLLAIKKTSYPREIYSAKCNALFDQLNSAASFYSNTFLKYEPSLKPIPVAEDVIESLNQIARHLIPNPD